MKPLELVEEQLRAYNSRDIEAFCRVYDDNVVVYSLKEDRVLFKGIDAFRENYTKLFSESPDLHADILQRTKVGDFIVDHERVSGRRGQTLEAVAIYKITDDAISHVWFAM